MTKYNVGTDVSIVGNFLKGKKGTIKKIGKTNNGERIFYVKPTSSKFTTAMLRQQIKLRRKK